jgi:cytochrome c oxidase subunit 2
VSTPVAARRAGAVLVLVSLTAAAATVVVFADAGPSGTRRAAANGPGPEAASAVILARGEEVYRSHCQACHGRSGEGGVAPKFEDGSAVARFPDVEDQVEFVLEGSRDGEPYGEGGEGSGGMPGWERVLSEAEVRAVVAYERSR